MRGLLVVNTVCFVPWSVYAATQNTHLVPFISSVWGSDVSASVGFGREEPNDGDCGREPGTLVVPYLPYVPPRARSLYGDACRVRPGAGNVCSVSTVVLPVVEKEVEAGRGGTAQGSSFDAGTPGEALDELVGMDSLLKIKEAAVKG